MKDKISTPPGFVSQPSFVLTNVPRDKASSSSVSGQGRTTADADSFNKSPTDRPWILHGRTTSSLKPLKSEVQAKRSKIKVLEEAPVFNPTEEEFSDTLSYIASLRDRAEPYGICCVVPPPSWKPSCLLEEKKIWNASMFLPQVQNFDGIYSKASNIKMEVDADIDAAAPVNVKLCRKKGTSWHTLESFKKSADASKKRYFRKDEEPTVADIEKEYRRIVENPLYETAVLCGNDLDTRTFGSGFPLPGTTGSCNYRTSGWNLNNTAKLPDSLLSFEDCESICAPRLSVGMCLSSQFWTSEKERLYSLCYLHLGAPRVWYSVAACHQSKFKDTMRSLIPEMSREQPNMSHDSVMVSPYALDGIPVNRCVQNPGQYVIIFPGSYYTAFDCGFNCLEKVNFAPLDWLPHGEVAVLQNQVQCKRSLISYTELLFNVAREAVKCLRDYTLNKKSANNRRWKEACGMDGIFSNVIKSRIKQELNRREYLRNDSLESKKMDKTYDDGSKRECSVCFEDLYLSAVKCSCSSDRYSCLRHFRKMCNCLDDKKSFVYRHTIDELNCLLDALVGNKLSAMFRWGDIELKECDSPAITTSNGVGEIEEGTETSVLERFEKEVMKEKAGENGFENRLDSSVVVKKRKIRDEI